jgi:hypothetical protein
MAGSAMAIALLGIIISAVAIPLLSEVSENTDSYLINRTGNKTSSFEAQTNVIVGIIPLLTAVLIITVIMTLIKAAGAEEFDTGKTWKETIDVIKEKLKKKLENNESHGQIARKM